MKLRKYFYAILCGLAVSTGFVSCSDDDEWNPTGNGSNIEMAQTRAFVLNEGSYGNNDASITYFNWRTDEPYSTDLFYAQNGTTIGDTGQDLIEDNDNLYLAVYGSNYIAKLNGVGTEIARVSLAGHSHLGQVRYLAADDGYLYATTYGGYVAKVNTRTMEIVDSVKVGDNPEQIIVEDGNIYCVNSGWGADNRLSIINERTFTLTEHVNIFYNPESIVETDDYIAIQGYGGSDYTNYPYPVAVFDARSKTYKEIGKGTKIAAEDGKLYVAYSETDWNTYATTTSFYSYNFRTGQKDDNVLKNIPEELTSSSVYGISINDENNHIYVMTSDYVSDGTVYHFDNNGNYVGKFSSYGISPKKIVFMD